MPYRSVPSQAKPDYGYALDLKTRAVPYAIWAVIIWLLCVERGLPWWLGLALLVVLSFLLDYFEVLDIRRAFRIDKKGWNLRC